MLVSINFLMLVFENNRIMLKSINDIRHVFSVLTACMQEWFIVCISLEAVQVNWRRFRIKKAEA